MNNTVQHTSSDSWIQSRWRGWHSRGRGWRRSRGEASRICWCPGSWRRGRCWRRWCRPGRGWWLCWTRWCRCWCWSTSSPTTWMQWVWVPWVPFHWIWSWRVGTENRRQWLWLVVWQRFHWFYNINYKKKNINKNQILFCFTLQLNQILAFLQCLIHRRRQSREPDWWKVLPPNTKKELRINLLKQEYHLLCTDTRNQHTRETLSQWFPSQWRWSAHQWHRRSCWRRWCRRSWGWRSWRETHWLPRGDYTQWSARSSIQPQSSSCQSLTWKLMIIICRQLHVLTW